MRNPFLPPIVALVITIVIAALASGTFAQSIPTPKVSPECRAEVIKLCPDTGDKKARRDCVILNHEKISQPCLAEMKAHRDAKRAAHKMATMPPTTPAPTAGQ